MYFSRTFFDNFLIIVLSTVLIRALFTKTISSDSTVDKREGRSWRLPNTTYPLKYNLHITTWIHREIFNFTGNVTIELMVKESTSELVLHAKDLEIQRIFIEDLVTNQKIMNLKSRTIDDLLVIDNLNQNNGDIFIRDHLLRLEIHYSGVIKEKNFGFQLTTYKIENTKKIYGAYTHMEPLEARKVLPCYDEPALKANFSVRITHGSNYTAISNMPAITTWQNDADNMTTTTFLETPKMCTYLLAFVVSNFKYISKNIDGILHRVFRPPNTKDRGELALDNSIKAVQTFGRYMDIPYSLSKIDHADVDLYLYGGMENWGLITYASSAFVQTQKEKDIFQILLQNHEIVHQWFGNLVSPTWWDSIWLNEGLTSYYSYILTDMLYPELKAMKSSFYENNCFQLISQPIVEYVEQPNDILAMFSIPVYSKAPCLLNMLSNTIGRETFHMGVKDYLKTHAYSSSKGNQFFHHLQTAMDSSNETSWKFNISEIMKPWFTTAAMPELLISRNYSNSSIIHIRQRPREISPDGIKKFWGIPMNFATLYSKDFESITYYMPAIPEVTLNLKKFDIKLRKSDTLLVTIPGITLYFVTYDDENLLQIARTLQENPNRINKINRVVIVRSINKIWSKQSSLVPTLELLKYLRQEQDNKVWSAISDDLLRYSNTLSANAKANNLLKKFLRNIVARQYEKLTKKPIKKLSPKESQLLNILTPLACSLNSVSCLSRSGQQFREHKKHIYDHGSVYDQSEICYAAKTFNNMEFVATLKFLKNADVNSTMYWKFLHCTNSEVQYKEFLNVLRDIPSNKDERNQHLSLWADLLTLAAADAMKWNSTYNFLMEQIPKLQAFTNAPYNLCSRIASKAEGIRAQFQLQYINLMNFCKKAILVRGGEFVSNMVVLSLKRIGAHYLYEKYPLWEQKIDEAQEWLEKETKTYQMV